MSDCRFDVSPVNYPDPDPDPDLGSVNEKIHPSHAFTFIQTNAHLCLLLQLHVFIFPHGHRSLEQTTS